MNLILPPLAAALRLQLLFLLLVLLLICRWELVLPMPLPPVRRNIIKVRASGFLPFESDLVLPLGILRQLQAQERISRVLPPARYAKPVRRKTKPKVKQQVRLERAHMRGGADADAGIQLYNLIDDDGELLLSLRVHSDTKSNSHSHGKSNNNNLDGDMSAPWRPSRWRPTTSLPLITSSSPRPLPLHQYLSSGNSVEQAPMTQQRRMFGARPDWIYH
ncbi:PREDICTED: uncharacterized protein LOC108618546 [Drosophila arizonae]|uniref:Uncharacterized protein LOC108618546 n=1 Tax=Drosophila arizonae TaxID=7263 RepID=A0ABM1PSA9_DROAR|nr:PREDICTED: uncharacterized protein LOC108618546 [Drosophila arizonae]